MRKYENNEDMPIEYALSGDVYEPDESELNEDGEVVKQLVNKSYRDAARESQESFADVKVFTAEEIEEYVRNQVDE